VSEEKWQMATRYEGYNGWLEVEGDVLRIGHEGFGSLTKIGPLQRPLSSVSGVHFRPATRLVNGHITVGFDGDPVTDPGGKAASDPNSLLFRHKDMDCFAAVHDWLRQVIQYNVSTKSVGALSADEPGGVDPRLVRSTELVPTSRIAATSTHELSGKVGRRDKAALRASFQELALSAARGDAEALGQLPVALADTRAYWRQGKLDDALWSTLVAAIDYVGQDDVLTVDEESHVVEVAAALGLPLDVLRDKAPVAFETLVVCRINDGRPPTLDDSPIMTKAGEVAYGSFSVALMKEVVQREFRGHTAGVSVPIGNGMRYRTGSVRGRSVVVGSELVAQDQGALTITSARSVFTGSTKTLEFRHDKLVGVQQYTDGLRLNVSNRQTASLFRFAKGEFPTVASALISHAISTGN
jgi:hypothetical protein